MRLADLIAPELRTRFPDHSLDFGARQLLSTDLGELSEAERTALSQAVSSRLPNMTIASQAGMKSSHGQAMSDRDAYARQPLPMRLMEQAGAGGLATLPSFSEKVNRTPHTPEPTNSAERIARGVGSGLVFGLEAVPIALTGGALGLPALATGAAAAGIPAALQAGTKKQRAIRGGVMAATGGTIGAVAKGAGAVAGPVAEKATHMVGGPVAFGAGAPWAEYGVSKVLGEKDVVAPTARDIAEGMVGLGILGAASSVGARGTSKPGPATPKQEARGKDASPSSDLLELGKGLDDSRSIPFAGKRTAAALYKERIGAIPAEATPEQVREIASRARREATAVQEVDDALRPPKTTASPDLLAAGRRIQERADQEMVGKRVAVETEKGPAFAEVAAVRVYPYPDVEMKARLILKDPQTGELFVQRYTDVAEMSKALSDPSSVDWASQGLGEGVKSEMGAATPGAPEVPQAVKGGVLANDLGAGPAGALGGGSEKPGQLGIGAAKAEVSAAGGPLAKAEAAPSQAAVGRATASGAGGAAVSLGPGPAPAASAGPGQTAASAAPTRFVAAHKLGERLYTAGNHGISYDKMLSDLSKTRPYPNPRNAEEIANNSADIEARATPAIEGFVDKATGEFYTRDQIESQYGTRWANDPNRPLNDWAGGAAVSPEPRPAPAAAKVQPVRPVLDQYRRRTEAAVENENRFLDELGVRNPETAVRGTNDWVDTWRYLTTPGRELLGRFGDAGKSMGDGIGKALDEWQGRSGKDVVDYRDAGRGLTEAQLQQVGHMLNGEAGPESLRPVVESVRRNTEGVINAAQEVGLGEKLASGKVVPIRRMNEWFQQVVREDIKAKVKKEGTPEHERQIEWMRKQDPTMSAGDARRALKEWMKMPGQIRESLQHERAMTIAPELREWNFLKVLPEYSLRSWRRIATARQFGPKDEHADAMLHRMAEEGHDAPAAATIWRGFIQPNPSGRGYPLGRMLGAIHTVTMLSTAGILQPSQLLTNTSARYGYLNTVRGIAQIMDGIVAGRLEVQGKIGATEAARRRSAIDFAERAGVAVVETVQDIVQRESKSITGRHVRMIGLEPGDKFNRVATGAISRLWAEDTAMKLVRDPESKAHRRDLKRVGLDPDQIIADKGVIPRSELERVARFASRETQFESSVLDLAAARNTALGQIVYRFRSFSAQTATMVRALVTDARQGNPAPLIRYLVNAATVNAAFGELVSFIRKQERPDNLFWRWVEDVTLVNALGIFGDAAKAVTGGDKGLASFVGGPTAGEAYRFAEDAYQVGRHGNTRPLLKHLVSRTPMLGPTLANWWFPSKKKKAA